MAKIPEKGAAASLFRKYRGFTPERPLEIEEFWLDAYPEIDTIPVKIAQMQKAGYIPVASFILTGKLLD